MARNALIEAKDWGGQKFYPSAVRTSPVGPLSSANLARDRRRAQATRDNDSGFAAPSAM